MRLLVTRPAADSGPLTEALRALGIEVTLEPMLTIDYREGPALDLTDVAGLLVTSANGLRAFAKRSAERGLPVYAVGDASARAARAAGFSNVESASGDVAALAELVMKRTDPMAGTLLHVAGTAVTGDLGDRLTAVGFIYRREVLYEARAAQALSVATYKALESGILDGVLFFSPRTARAFVTLLAEHELDQATQAMTAFCLSPAVAATAAALSWDALETAERPDQAALLAVVEDRLRRDRL